MSDEDDMDSSWEKRLVKRYYEKLFKEYPFMLNIVLTKDTWHISVTFSQKLCIITMCRQTHGIFKDIAYVHYTFVALSSTELDITILYHILKNQGLSLMHPHHKSGQPLFLNTYPLLANLAK